MPRLKTETFGTGDQSWLGSARDIATARTENLDISTFTKNTHYPDGFVRSGTPVAKVGGVLIPYVSGGSGGAEVLAGFVLTDQVTDGVEDPNVPLHDTGRIKTSRLPVSFTKPSAANDATTCVYV